MPSFNIVRESQASSSFRAKSVIDRFDLESSKSVEHFVGEINFPNEWNVGLIVGASGTGKTTIAKELFPDSYVYDATYAGESVVDDMPESNSVSDICNMFSSVGFSSPPSWLKPYNALSNGQKMRVDLARALLGNEKLIVFDEFTSVVDRHVAKIGSYAVQKAVRNAGKQFIAVGCHYDVEDWLLPDWVFDTNIMEFRIASKKKDQTSSSSLSKSIERNGTVLVDTII